MDSITGTYYGVLPPDIKTTLTLNADGTYLLIQAYKEKQKEIINRKRDNKPVVVIKATDNASFVNLVSALDEMQINGFNTFQINKLNKNDSILLNDFYAKHPDHLTKK